MSGPAADFDWILDVQLADEAAARAFIAANAYADVLKVVAGATKHEWTARMTHLMRGPYDGLLGPRESPIRCSSRR